MKLILPLLFIVSVSANFLFEQRQVNFGDKVKPDASAAVQITSTDKGFLPSRMTTAQRDAIVSPATGLIIYNTDANEYQNFNGVTWVNTGGGNVSHPVNQPGHGRPIGCPLTPVYNNAGVWTDARADAEATLATHVIVQVYDIDNFEVAQVGRYDCPAHGLLVNEHYFTSEVTAGTLTPTPPMVYENPVVYLEDANTAIIVNLRASAATGGTSAVLSVFGRNGNVTAQANDYTANLVGFTPAGNIIATEVQGAIQELDTEKVPSGTVIDALAAFNSDGLMTQTALGVFTSRVITPASTRITVTNGDGVAGNPTIDVDESQLDINNIGGVGGNYIDWTAATDNFSTTGTAATGNLTVTGTITSTGTVNGRDMTTDGTKLDGIEPLADVTDSANVQAAGAVMSSFFGGSGVLATDGLGSFFNRILTPGSSKVTIANPDGALGDPTIDIVENQIDITQLLNYSANNDVDHTTVGIDVSAVGDGLLGGGDMTTFRTLRVDINSEIYKPAPLAGVDELFLWDVGINQLRKTTVADIAASVPLSGEANTASNLGAGAGVFESKVAFDLRFKSLTSGSSKLSITPNATEIDLDVDESQLDITQLNGYDANRYVDHTTVSITGVQGLGGGGTIDANRTINLDLNSLPNETVIAAGDLVAIYDQSAGAHRNMTRADFLTGLVAAPVDSVFGRTGAVVAVAGDYTASEIDNVPAGGLVATDVQGALNELDGEVGTNTTNIATNTGNIGTNTTNITTNTGNISTNATNIGTNTTNIGLNTTAIGVNATAIANLDRGDLIQGGYCELSKTSNQLFVATATDELIEFDSFEVQDASYCTFNAGTDELTLVAAGRYRIRYQLQSEAVGATTYRGVSCNIEQSTGGPFAAIARGFSQVRIRTGGGRERTSLISEFSYSAAANENVRIVCQVSAQSGNTQIRQDSLLTVEYMGP